MTKSHWKAISIDYDKVNAFDQSIIIPVCLNQKQIAILKALLTTAYWTTRWTSLSITPDELDAEISQIEYKLDGNECYGGAEDMDYRDNPLDPCEVQYSKDGGETWLTMFRKDNCMSGSLGDVTIINNAITEIENNYTTYDGDITNIAPKWGWVDEYSDHALCWALSQWVDLICSIAIADIQSSNHNQRKLDDLFHEVIQQIAALAIVASPLTGGMSTAVVAAFAWAFSEIAQAWWDDLVTADRKSVV